MPAMHRARGSRAEALRFLKTFIYIVLFYQKTYAYSIDVVFAVAKEFLYSVFFGFTKPIKRPCETNLALTISLRCTTHRAAGSPGSLGRGARSPQSARGGGRQVQGRGRGRPESRWLPLGLGEAARGWARGAPRGFWCRQQEGSTGRAA